MALAWSFCIVDAQGHIVAEEASDTLQSTASVGKIFLLCEVAERIADGRLDPSTPVPREHRLAVADSGLWQHLMQAQLPVIDLAVLVASVSDNWATNALLEIVGIGATSDRARALGCSRSALHDRVRDTRTADDPVALSSGTARELAGVSRRIHVVARGGDAEGLSPEAARLVEGWLLTGVDLSMVAAPFRLDPLAHAEGPVRLWSKTGADTCVRADAGVVWNDSHSLSYAAIATWQPGDDVLDVAFERMRAVGSSLASRMW